MLWKLVVLVLSIVSLSGHCEAQCGSGCGGCDCDDRDKTWLIGYGHDYGGHEYFDEQGYIRGLSGDVIDAVCQAANIDCRAVWVPYSWCWASGAATHSYGGEGIMDSWVDGCIGWFHTTDRVHVFDFSLPYMEADICYFFVRPGESATFNTGDLAGQTIGFISGWYSDEKCLARQESDTRQNYILSEDQVRYTASASVALAALQNSEIDAIFAGYGEFASQLDSGILEYMSGTPITCAFDGGSIMTRKDSNLIDYWNKGFMKLKSTGKFQQLCAEAQAKHGSRGQFKCVL